MPSTRMTTAQWRMPRPVTFRLRDGSRALGLAWSWRGQRFMYWWAP